MNEKFWMLYVEDGGKPNQVYLNEDGALTRAKSLARQTRRRVFILEAVKVVSAVMPEVDPIFVVDAVH